MTAASMNSNSGCDLSLCSQSVNSNCTLLGFGHCLTPTKSGTKNHLQCTAPPQITRLSPWSFFWGAAGPAGTAGWRGHWQILGWAASPADCSDATRGTADSGTWRTPRDRRDTSHLQALPPCKEPAGTPNAFQWDKNEWKLLKRETHHAPSATAEEKSSLCPFYLSFSFSTVWKIRHPDTALHKSCWLLWEFGISCLASGC